MSRLKYWLSISLLSVGLIPIQAVADWTEQFDVHGFVAQGLAYTSGNGYISDDNGWSGQMTEAGINFQWQGGERWRVAAQAIYLNGGNRYPEGGRLDYALLDYTLYAGEQSDLHLMLGRYKNAHGIYRDSRDVPFTQPSIILPQSVYWDMYRDQTLNTDGASFSGYSSTPSGYLDWQLSSGRTDIEESMSSWVLGPAAKGRYHEDWVVQGSLFYTSIDASWVLGVSGLRSRLAFDASADSPVVEGHAHVTEMIGTFRYEGDNWQLTAEYIFDNFKLNGLFAPGFSDTNRSDGYYAQLIYWLRPNLSLLGRYDVRCLDIDDRSGEAFSAQTGLAPWFRYAKDWTFGASWQFAPNWMARAEIHAVEGVAWLPPHLSPDPVLHDQQHWMLGALQLSYQF